MIKVSKRIFAFILILMMTFSVLVVGASAEESGTCGKTLTWTFNETTCVLTISGTGDMYDWSNFTDVPWYSYRSSIKSVTIGNSVTSIGDRAFYYCESFTSITIPDSVTSIGVAAFSGCDNLTSVTIGNSVTSIGNDAFSSCTSLASIIIPDSVTSIGIDAFEECYGLTSVTIGNGVTSIGSYAFYRCGRLTSITIPNSVRSMGESAFYGCHDLISVTIGNGVTSIGEFAFEGCTSLASITIPDGVTSIGFWAFYECYALANITIGNSVTSINVNAFDSCTGLESITVSSANTAYSSDDYGVLFNKDKTELIHYPIGNKRTSYIVPDSVTSIGYYAFMDCINLESITIPDSVTSIGGFAFDDCTSLSDIYYTGTEAEWNKIAVYEYNDALLNATIYFNSIPGKGVYNLGEETYSFKNFGDGDSLNGHCFGMSATSSGYYIDELNIEDVGGSKDVPLYDLSRTEAVTAPICYYQAIQGSYSANATVAGGSYYLTDNYDINSDWNEVVNYVKNHEFDNRGVLQIGLRKSTQGGHAINFLRYEEVDGQARIYAYDNNFPNIETYFWMDENGKVWQEPYSTFSGSIDCIALRSVPEYFDMAGSFDFTRCIYAENNMIAVNGAEMYPIDCGEGNGERVVFEIPADAEQVIITPLSDDATFTYLNEEYSLSNIGEEMVGVLTLADSNDASSSPDLAIVDVAEIIEAELRTPSTTTISYGDSIILHVDLNEALPEGWRIEWSADNGNFSYSTSADGTTCTITPSSSGDTTFTVKVFDAQNNEISSDTQKMTSKAGFFDKIIAFFKKIFGLTKILPSVWR